MHEEPKPVSKIDTQQEKVADTLWDINGELATYSAETPRGQVLEKILSVETIAEHIGNAATMDIKMEMFVTLQHAEKWNMVEHIPHVKAIAESLREA